MKYDWLLRNMKQFLTEVESVIWSESKKQSLRNFILLFFFWFRTLCFSNQKWMKMKQFVLCFCCLRNCTSQKKLTLPMCSWKQFFFHCYWMLTLLIFGYVCDNIFQRHIDIRVSTQTRTGTYQQNGLSHNLVNKITNYLLHSLEWFHCFIKLSQNVVEID